MNPRQATFSDLFRAAIVLGLALLAGMVLLGCAGPAPRPVLPPGTNDVPGFAVVEPSVYRGGQPAGMPGWQYIASLGVSNVIKLDTSFEGDDSLAEMLGMKVYRYPIDTLQQLVTGPDPLAVAGAVDRITPGTFVHCLHGQDRTGLVVGMYRLKEGTNSPAAWGEMLEHGYHPALQGLTRFWQQHTTP